MTDRKTLCVDRRTHLKAGDLVYASERRGMGPFPNYDREGRKIVTMVREYHYTFDDVINDYRPINLTIMGVVKDAWCGRALVEWYGRNPFGPRGPRTDWVDGCELCPVAKLEEIEDIPDHWTRKK